MAGVRTSMALAAALGCSWSFTSTDAIACGGTFCDRPPPGSPPMPVDQSGENVLFVTGDGYVEAHVQIQYEGDPERFAWVVPMPAIPEISVGSQEAFVRMLNATVPTYSRTTTTLLCSSDGDVVGSRTSSGGGMGCGSSSASSFDLGGGAGEPGGAPETESSDETVVLRDSVGSFDVTVLMGDTVEEVTSWLDTNDFLVEPEAVPLLGEYVREGYFFVAVRLNGGVGVDEIHPLMFRYPGDVPAIPLRLTAVAATDDMGVRAFFLDTDRVYPTNYRHVILNELYVDWQSPGRNYVDAVGRAVDAPGADGHAFVTEYSGSARVVDTTGLVDSRWDPDALRDIAPTEAVEALESQGLVTCPSTTRCSAAHPLVPTLLRKYLPAPTGVDETSFYACLSCNEGAIDLEAWDGNAFADDVESMIVAPARHAADVFATKPTLTRLFTTLSPEEMTADPAFAPGPRAPVSTAKVATETIECDGRRSIAVGGYETCATGSGTTLPFDGLSPAERIEEWSADGDHTVVDDQRETIGNAIHAQNAEEGFPYERGLDRRPGSSPGSTSSSMGCGCQTHAQRALPAYVLASFVVALGVRRQRRRRRAATPAAGLR